MHLLVIRHAIAEDKEVFARTGRGDDLRPLTDEGRAKMRRAAAGLRAIAPKLALVATSPLVRARQTAEIVVAALGPVRTESVEVLRPDRDFDEFIAWLQTRAERENDGAIAVVGHEPHLAGLVTWLMTGFDESRIELKKGGACLLNFEGELREGGAALLWLLTPSQLRELGD